MNPRSFHDRALIWDNHACFPLNPNSDLSELQRYRDNGVTFVSLNVGMDMDSFENVMRVLACFRRHIDAHPDSFVLARRVDDIRAAQASGRLAIAFDLEGSEPLMGDVNLVSLYYDLGVRQMLLAYNKDNRASGGCMEGSIGLTEFGRAVVREMNRVGMVVDASHMGYRATLELFEISEKPVIFSHSNPKGVKEHARNISDEQIRFCAQSGGVIGINGIGDFLGGSTDAAMLVRHIEYVMDLVGPQHVGIGLDYVVDKQELIDYIQGRPDVFPPEKFNDYLAMAEPERLPAVAELLLKNGHSETEVRGVMGGNFLRVAEQTWK